MISRLSSYSLFILFALLASGLYLVKYQVQDLKNNNIALQHKIESEQLALRMLEAEWVYLNRPDRLENLVQKYLPMQAMVPTQVVQWTDIPARPTAVAMQASEVR